MKRFIISTLILSTVIVGKAQNAIPQSLRELSKWEKAMKVKANSGDADACRLLALSNIEKYAKYGQYAFEQYAKQNTGEAYYHMAELCFNKHEMRDSFLLLSSQLGYAKADEQIKALKTYRIAEDAENLSELAMRDMAMNIDLKYTAEEAKFYMETARKFQTLHHRREAIWYYDLAYHIDPEGCSSALTLANSLRTEMRSEKSKVQQQLREEQLQREINSQQWQQLANAASELVYSLQNPQRITATTYSSQHAIPSSNTITNKETIELKNKTKALQEERRENQRERALERGKISFGYEKIEVKCKKCGGSGQQPCHVCHGKILVTCHVCNGRGYPAGFKNRECTFCHGKTTVKCSFCYGKGTEGCISCNGKGTKWEFK